MSVVNDNLSSRLRELTNRPENAQCADCAEAAPTWASTNWGAFICAQCAGVHRSLGVEKSFVLSCNLDDWTDDQIDHLATKGNKKVNDELEYWVPKTIEVPFQGYTDRDTREKYIRAKYVDQLFRKTEGRTPQPPIRKHRKTSSNSSRGSPTSIRDAGMVEFVGIVDVQLIEGKDLVIKDIVSSDPYCVLSLGLQTWKSTTKSSTLNPQYNESFSFSWDGKSQLFIELFDHDDLSKDDHMGCVDIDLEFLKTNSNKPIRFWYPVTHRKQKDRQQGELCLEITYIPIQ